MAWPGISLLMNFFPEATWLILHETFLWKLDLVRQERGGNKAKLRLLLISHLRGEKVTHNAYYLLHLAVRAIASHKCVSLCCGCVTQPPNQAYLPCASMSGEELR